MEIPNITHLNIPDMVSDIIVSDNITHSVPIFATCSY